MILMDMVDNMKGKIMIKLFTLLFVMVTMSANAADVTIDMLNKDGNGNKMVYSKEIAEVAVGDTITWLPASKGHNVHFISAPDGIKKLPKSKLNKEYSYTFEKEGIYLYQCTPHKGMGMIALVVVGDNLDNLANIKKARVLGKSKKKLKELLSQL
jgi:pseudoazurin